MHSLLGWNFLVVSNSEAKSELPPANSPSIGLPDHFAEVQFFIQFMIQTMNLSLQGQSWSVLALPSVILLTILVNHIHPSLPNLPNLATFKSVSLLLNWLRLMHMLLSKMVAQLWIIPLLSMAHSLMGIPLWWPSNTSHVQASWSLTCFSLQTALQHEVHLVGSQKIIWI